MRQRAAILTPLGYEQVSVSQAAASLSVPSDRVIYAEISVSTADVRYRDDGVDPDATTGMPLVAGEKLEYNGDPSKLVFFAQTTTDATLDVLYYED